MECDITDIQTNSTKGSALAIGIIALAVGALCVYGAYYLNANPDALEGMMGTVAMILLAIFAIFLIATFIYMIAAVFFYAAKGEEVQTNGNYSIDDIESVKETSSEKKEN